jgi:hypothetical protein
VARLRTVLTVAILGGVLGACGVVEGLSQYSKGECSQGCDDAAPGVPTTEGGSDAAQEDALRHDGDDDAPPSDDGEDADGSWMTSDDSSSGGDSAADASDGGPTGGGDAGDGSGGDAGDGGGGDAGDGGCGPLNTVQNCGACGVACNMTTGTPSCTGAVCTYVCTAGRSDCDSVTGPDTNGCECATPGCCGSGCETTHSTGVGPSFYDCNSPSTFTEATAISACTAYALSVGGTAGNCSGGWKCNSSTVQDVCYSTNGKSCGTYCWRYMDADSGASAGAVVDCACPSSEVGAWN